MGPCLWRSDLLLAQSFQERELMPFKQAEALINMRFVDIQHFFLGRRLSANRGVPPPPTSLEAQQAQLRVQQENFRLLEQRIEQLRFNNKKKKKKKGRIQLEILA